MSDSSNQAKTPSIAAFLFLPQFGKMFRGAAHIVPIFMRTIANLLVQASLLPQTHPATLYGDPGVEKCSFTEMLGDAWYTLRSNGATPYQWSVFCSVVLIVFFIVSSVIMTIINLSSVFVTSAAAQIFTNVNGVSDFASLPNDTTTGWWNSTFPVPGAGTAGAHSQDYAIAFLDDMLRFGAASKGGPLQNAVGAMMQVYNSGIMVIAGIMIFWLIVSVVVDTAKTGQIGGGRHNMVWAPIRIIFALGLMVPLGASGFSSGQFMVMKIAELGSNLGSNAWHAYLNAIKNQEPFYKLPAQKNLMALTGHLLRSWVCIVAHNGYSDQAEGSNLPDAQIIYRYDNIGLTDNGMKSFSYRKQTGANECGTVTYPTVNDTLLTTQMNVVKQGGTDPNPIEAGKLQFKIDMIKTWQDLFYKGASNPPTMSNGKPIANPGMDQPDGSPQTKIEQIANSFACEFVSQHIWGQEQNIAANGTTSNGLDVLHLNCNGGNGQKETARSGGVSCGGGVPASGQYPDMSCVEGSTGSIDYIMQAAILKDVQAAYNNDITPLQKDIFSPKDDHGWADMGDFFQKLASVNRFVLDQSTVPVSITQGSIPDEGGLSEKINEVVDKFDVWWQKVPLSSSASITTSQTNAFERNINTGGPKIGVETSGGGSGGGSGGSCSFWSISCQWHKMTGGISALVHFFGNITTTVKKIGSSPLKYIAHKFSEAIHGDLIDLVAPDIQDKTVYPLSVLVNLGHSLIGIGVGIHVAILTVVVILALFPTVSVGDTVANSTLVTLLGIFGTIFLSCGATLSFWLPALPMIRVAFAVLTWGVTVFEAVALVPIAALSFLSTTGEGWDAKHVFLNWLDVFTRPVLTVVGFVGALLLFNTFFSYFYVIYKSFMHTQLTMQSGIFDLVAGILSVVSYTIIFFCVIYGAANTCFKMISTIPDAFFRWAPIGGSRSGAGGAVGDGGDHGGAVGRAGGMMGESMGGATKAVRAGGDAAKGESSQREAGKLASDRHREMIDSLKGKDK